MIYAIDINKDNFAPAKFDTVSVFLNVLLPLATAGAALIFLVMMLRAAFNIITHGDNPEAIKKAQQSMVFAILGLLIVILSFLFVRLIGKILGVNDILPI